MLRVFALVVLDDILGFFRLEIHRRIVHDNGRSGETKINLSGLVLRLGLHKVYPRVKGDVRCRSTVGTISVVKEGSSRALCGIVKLHEEEIEPRVLDCVRKVSIWHNALRRARYVTCRLLVALVQ